MKIALFVVVGLVAVFGATQGEAAGNLASALQQQVEQYGLSCDNSQIQIHCANSDGRVAILKAACPLLLQAYLCEQKQSEEELQAALRNFVGQGNQ